jgi:hypothetical protein
VFACENKTYWMSREIYGRGEGGKVRGDKGKVDR